MAYVNSRSASASISDRVSALLRHVKDALARRRAYLQTLHELNSLSDRELDDLGISRANITDLARAAAHSK